MTLERERAELLHQAAALTTRCQNQQYLLFLAEQGHDLTEAMRQLQATTPDAPLPALRATDEATLVRESMLAFEIMSKRCTELEISVQNLRRIVDLHEAKDHK